MPTTLNVNISDLESIVEHEAKSVILDVLLKLSQLRDGSQETPVEAAVRLALRGTFHRAFVGGMQAEEKEVQGMRALIVQTSRGQEETPLDTVGQQLGVSRQPGEKNAEYGARILETNTLDSKPVRQTVNGLATTVFDAIFEEPKIQEMLQTAIATVKGA